MHSKWQIWDYFSSFQREFLGSFNGVLALNTFDPVCLKMVKDHLMQGSGGRVVLHKTASEVTRSWIEEEFQTLSLFGGVDCFFIHQASDLKVDLIEALSQLDLPDRFIILSFESEPASWKKIVKEGKVSTLVLEAPRFWELNKLLDFVGAFLKVPLSYDAKTWILDSLENDLATFYNACHLIKLNHPEAKDITKDQVRSLFNAEKLDQFALASLYTRKRFVDFFDRLILLEGDFEKMRGFFNFMQSHLIKMADLSYLATKNRLTQYDKDLQSTSKLWKNTDLMREIDRFNEWELKCKKKHHLLWSELREAQLRVLNRAQ